MTPNPNGNKLYAHNNTFQHRKRDKAVTSIEEGNDDFTFEQKYEDHNIKQPTTSTKENLSNKVFQHYESYLKSSLHKRLQEEFYLMSKLKYSLAIPLLYLIFICNAIFRNLAYYRYDNNNGVGLKDLMFELIPHDEEMVLSKRTDVPFHLIQRVALAFFIIGSLYEGEKHNKPYITNVVRRFLAMFAIAHTLRFITYIGTTLPGSSMSCLNTDGSEAPKTIMECFTRLAPINGNCGDLVFSGHTTFMVLLFMLVNHYGLQIYKGQIWKFRFFQALFVLVIIWQIHNIIAARNHYTVDIIIALYLIPLLWYFYINEIQKEDAIVDYDEIAKMRLSWNSYSTRKKITCMVLYFFYFVIVALAAYTLLRGNLKWIYFGKYSKVKKII